MSKLDKAGNMKARFSPLLTLIVLSLVLPLGWRLIATSVAAQNDQRRLVQVPITTLPVQAKRWALVIGVDQYRDSQINRLKGADNDAKTLAEALTLYAGFPADQVVLLATDQPEERQPTRVNIQRRLSNLRTVVPKDGLLLVSFAGHGLERAGRAYLLPTDAQYSDDIALVEETALSVNRMKDSIRAIGVQQVIVLLDACRNDPTGRGVGGNSMSAAYKFDFDVRNREVTAFATLYATAVGQLAYEYSEKRQGYFTWAIVEALKGATVNTKGEVTLAALLKYVQEAVPKRVGIDLGAGKQQKPFAEIEGYLAADLVIAFVPKLYSPLNVPALANSVSAESQDWQKIKDSKDPEQFREFLRKYPGGQFAELARNRLAALQPAQPQPIVDTATLDLQFWNSIKDSKDPKDFEAYKRRFPNGTFSELADNRLATLRASRGSTSPPTPNEPSSANAIASKDISSLRVVLKSVMRVNLTSQMGQRLNGIRCAFEFINLETQKPIVVAMNAIAPDRSLTLIGSYLRSTLVDENGGLWRLPNSDVAGMRIVGVGQQGYARPNYDPAEIATVLSKRDDLNSDVTIDQRRGQEYRFIFGSTTEMSPGQSLSVTMSFVQDVNRTTSDVPPKVFQMATEIVVGVVTSGTKKSYTLYNLTFDRVSLPGR